jgi:hypothetical protein
MNKDSEVKSKYTGVGVNNILIGLNSGINLTNESNVVIIGDNIPDLNRNQKNVLFIGEKVAIGKTLMGNPINLAEEIIKQLDYKPEKKVLSNLRESLRSSF